MEEERPSQADTPLDTLPGFAPGEGGAPTPALEGSTRAEAPQVEAAPEVEAVALTLRRTTKRLSRGPSPDLRSRVYGRYEVRDQLGRGGSGAVYRAWDPRCEREVALKVMLRADERALLRFRRECRAIGRLHHASIVPLLDSGDENGVPYLVMELIHGRSLAQLTDAAFHAESGSAPVSFGPDAAARVVRDAARALHYAHEQGVIHRDVKPHNLLVDEHGRTLVVDFGLAHLLEDAGERITQSGATLGTPAYMAPEQAGHLVGAGKLDMRSDVYSLGATLFHALTGEGPFDRAAAGEQVVAVMASLHCAPPRPSELAPRVPPELDAVVLRCLEKDPARRYPTAAALADDLDRFLEGRPLDARPIGRVERVWRALRRDRVRAALVLGLVGVCLAFALLAARHLALLAELERLRGG